MPEKSKNKTKEKVTKKTLFFMLRTARKEKPMLFLLYGFLFLADIMEKVQVILLPKFLLDELVAVQRGEALQDHIRRLIGYVILYMGLAIACSVMRNIANNKKDVQAEWFNEFFETELADKALRMDFEHTEDPKVLEQLNKAKEGISWYSGGVVGILDTFYRILINIVILAGVLAIILVTCPLLIPIQLSVLCFITYWNAKRNKVEVENFLKLAKSNRIFFYVLYQLPNFQYGKEIRLYDSADMMGERAKDMSYEQLNIWKDSERRKRKESHKMDVINSFRDGISYFYIGYLALKKKITLGEFSMCVESASSLYWSLNGIVSGWQDVTKRCNYASQFLKFLEYSDTMPKGNQAVKKQPHTIEFVHVGFRYPRTQRFVLRDINLTIQPGEHLSIVGLNGAGKTTLIKLLCRLYDVTEGRILIDGVDIREYAEDEYRKLFAVVFQDFQLFAFSLRENVSLSGKADDEEIRDIFKLTGFYEDSNKLENGLDTMLYKSFDEHGTELSGGQQQKTAIGRALYRHAPIIILDEPTAALDPVAEYDIYRQFHTLVGGKTAIYISHRLSSCKFCDHIAVFAEDTIKEYGTHDELVGIPDGIYAGMFATQAQYYVDNAG